MILIDRDNETQEIILTLDGVIEIAPLSLTHDATRKAFSLPLGLDISASTRYALFSVPTADFEDMPEGYYSYVVKEAVTGLEIESGKALVKPTPGAAIPTVPDTSTDYLVNE